MGAVEHSTRRPYHPTHGTERTHRYQGCRPARPDGSQRLIAVCGGCGRRAPQLEVVVPVRKQAFVGGLE